MPQTIRFLFVDIQGEKLMKLNKPVLKWTHIMKLTQNWLHCGESRANWPRYTYTYITWLQYKTQKHISQSTSRKEAYFPVLLYFKPWSKCTLTNLYFVQGNCIIYHVCFNRRGNAIDIWTITKVFLTGCYSKIRIEFLN